MRTITTYERFHRHISAWAAGETEVLLVVGPPGLGKSHSYEQILADVPHHLFRARRTPICVYNDLHDNPDWPVVFDDISALLNDNNFLDTLKSLCEIGHKCKTVRWGTTTRHLEGRAKFFTCTSRVLIIMNSTPTKRADVMAVLDRCDAVRFAPTKKEVIARMRVAFPRDGDLIDLLERMPILPSLRDLIKARSWKDSTHLNVIEELLSECGLPEAVSTLITIISEHPEREWCERYSLATGNTDRTYRRHKQLATQIVDCRAIQKPCPNVRAVTDSGLTDALPDNRTAKLGFLSNSRTRSDQLLT
jgi:hypothetical protein